MLIVSVVTCLLFYRFVERPLLDRLSEWRKAEPPRGSLIPAIP
jgi:peptidoglycan/LPS O-acetylase OafA/YrhL